MQVVKLELLNEQAYLLLQQLEQLKIVRLIEQEEIADNGQKRKWSGSISKITANKMLQSTEESRSEWERVI